MLKSPYPYIGGKSTVAKMVWERFGTNIGNYVEPFFGSGAMLLARPGWNAALDVTETVNDKDGFISNFWRAVQKDPEAVADYVEWPINETDLHARHAWLVGQKDSMQQQLEGDPDWYDVKVAGWWVWGMALWIGSGFCSGNGSWQSVEGRLVRQEECDMENGIGISRRRPHLSSSGQGIKRQRPHLTGSMGVVAKRSKGRKNQPSPLSPYMHALADRVRAVRVCCGDWLRVCSPNVLFAHSGQAAVFLDPPYSEAAGRADGLYTVDSLSIAHDVRRWCLENGQNPLLKIALCGYENEHEELRTAGWLCKRWFAQGGMANIGESKKENRFKEVVWFSPHCNTPSGFNL